MAVKIRTQPSDAGRGEALHVPVVQEPVVLHESGTSLDDAARALLSVLPEQCRNILGEIALQQAVPQWMLLAGLLLRMYEMGEHTAPSLSPEWIHSTPAVMRAVLPDATCPICNTPFTPRWRGQLYDTGTCGAVAERTRLDRAAAERAASRKPAPLGMERNEDCKSTLIPRPDGVPDALADAGRGLADALQERKPFVPSDAVKRTAGERAAAGTVGQTARE